MLIVDKDGEWDRIVEVFRRGAHNGQGCILVQLGKLVDGQLELNCKLPGGKKSKDEDVDLAQERLLREELAPLASHLPFSHKEEDVEWAKSKHVGLRTKYRRAVFHCECRDGMDELPVVAQGHILQRSSEVFTSSFPEDAAGGRRAMYSGLTPDEFAHLGGGLRGQLHPNEHHDRMHGGGTGSSGGDPGAALGRLHDLLADGQTGPLVSAAICSSAANGLHSPEAV